MNPPARPPPRLGPLSLDRALDVIEHLATRAGPVGFVQLIEELELGRPVASRLLKCLVARGWLAKDPGTGRYGPGAQLRAMAVGANATDRELLSRFTSQARAAVEALRAKVHQTAMAIFWNGVSMQCVARAVHEDALPMWAIGTVQTEVGEYPWGWICALAANLPRQPLPNSTAEERRRQEEAALAALARYPDCGFTADSLEHPHRRRLAAAVVDGRNQLVGCLCVGGNPLTLPAHHLDHCGRELVEAARKLSIAMGWQPARRRALPLPAH